MTKVLVKQESTKMTPESARTADDSERLLSLQLKKTRVNRGGDAKSAGFAGNHKYQGNLVKDFSYRFFKRSLDILLGSALLVLCLPIVAVAALMIRLESPGSPFFFQSRLGINGKPFRIFKLRGMYINARERFPHLYDYSTKQDLDFYFHHESDPRVTRAGRITRKMSIDELPNFWNVVAGDMSLVGPRPEIPEVLALYGSYRDEYLSVKPGITCLSKCSGRDRLTKSESIKLDIKYIRERTFKKDLEILWRTFLGVVLRRNVY